MRKAKRWRYYCSFCKKSGGSSYHMERHEKGCTANPDRICGMHNADGDLCQPDLKKIISQLRESWPEWDFQYTPETMAQMNAANDWLKEQVDGCPACILHVYRMLQVSTCPDKDFARQCDQIYFDYKEVKAEFWANHPREDYYRGGYCD